MRIVACLANELRTFLERKQKQHLQRIGNSNAMRQFIEWASCAVYKKILLFTSSHLHISEQEAGVCENLKATISKFLQTLFCRLFFQRSQHLLWRLGELVNLQSPTLFPRSRLGDENMSESGHKHNQQKDRKGKLITANHKESLWACVSATIRTAKRTSTSH